MTRKGYKKHRELIEKWVEGADIQVYNQADNVWEDVENPEWIVGREYRVRPTPLNPEKCKYNKSEYQVDLNGEVSKRLTENIPRNQRKMLFKNFEVAQSYSVLPQLIRLRDEVNQDWNADWSAGQKYVILIESGSPRIVISVVTRGVLCFETEQKAQAFLEDYRELIEKAKMLL